LNRSRAIISSQSVVDAEEQLMKPRPNPAERRLVPVVNDIGADGGG
jgi:hypothetical protein